MRRGVLVFIIINVVIIGLLVRSVYTLLTLLVEDASADAIPRDEIPSVNASIPDDRPLVIPKIIHQTYKTENIPEIWREPQRSCIELHPDYEYKVRPIPLLGAETTKLTGCVRHSSGRMRRRGSSLRRNIRGSWRLLTTTLIPSSGRIQYDILSCRIMEGSILIWTMYGGPCWCHCSVR